MGVLISRLEVYITLNQDSQFFEAVEAKDLISLCHSNLNTDFKKVEGMFMKCPCLYSWDMPWVLRHFDHLFFCQMWQTRCRRKHSALCHIEHNARILVDLLRVPPNKVYTKNVWLAFWKVVESYQRFYLVFPNMWHHTNLNNMRFACLKNMCWAWNIACCSNEYKIS